MDRLHTVETALVYIEQQEEATTHDLWLRQCHNMAATREAIIQHRNVKKTFL